MDSGLGQHLAVHVDAGELQAVHEGGVVHAVCLACRADTGDPQLTEVAFFLLAADGHILTKKDTKRCRRLRSGVIADVTNEATIKKMIPYK